MLRITMAVSIIRIALTALLLASSSVLAAAPGIAIITEDRAALRSAARDSAQSQAVLWPGELVEVRGRRMDYLQVYDYKRERGGYVRASHARELSLTADEAPDLLAIVRFLRDTPGAESLGLGYAAAFIQAAPAEVAAREPGLEALDAMGTFADRLARRASSSGAQAKAVEAALAAHLDVAKDHGVRFANVERDGRMHICYDGDAFRRVLAMRATPAQRARAALGLTHPHCVSTDAGPLERSRVNEAHAQLLNSVDVSLLPAYLRNRVLMRRATAWSAVAFHRVRKGDEATSAAARAVSDLAAVARNELPDADITAYNDAVMRVSASRWGALPSAAAGKLKTVRVVTLPREPGETCVLLVDAKHDASNPLAQRCTYAFVWTNSATLNREGNALALAVQPLDTWRELWIFRKEPAGWTVRVLPPAAATPEVGYAEFAGWVPGGHQVLVAREARADGKYRRSFELVRLDTLMPARQASDAMLLGAFQRWQDPSWKAQTLSLR